MVIPCPPEPAKDHRQVQDWMAGPNHGGIEGRSWGPDDSVRPKSVGHRMEARGSTKVRGLKAASTIMPSLRDAGAFP
jgi:hypothetical protein